MNMNYKNLGLVWTGSLCFALCFYGCTDDVVTGLSAPIGTPVTVLAEISPVTKSETALGTSIDNSFDRETFVDGDQIKVTRTRTATTQTANYRYNSSSAWTVVGTSPVTLEPAATYTAQFPADYDGIKQYQNTPGNYLASNLLQTDPVTSRDGTLNFTNNGDGKPFKHINSKLTIVFTVNRTATIANDAVTVEAKGIRTNASSNQSITLYRPHPDDVSRGYEWCGIVRSVGETSGNPTTDLTVSLTCDGVTYKATLSACPLRTGYHYKYTLTLHNDLLIPESCTIGNWTENIMSGGNLT